MAADEAASLGVADAVSVSAILAFRDVADCRGILCA